MHSFFVCSPFCTILQLFGFFYILPQIACMYKPPILDTSSQNLNYNISKMKEKTLLLQMEEVMDIKTSTYHHDAPSPMTTGDRGQKL